MTFIDEALKNCHSGEEFVQAMASVYEYPEVKNNLKDYPEWIRNIIAIVDYDTELQMEGLECKFYHDVIEALRVMGLDDEAEVLSVLCPNSTDETIAICMDKLALYNDYEDFWNQVFLYAEKNLLGLIRQ